MEYLSSIDVFCKELNPIPIKELNSRKKIDIYIGIDLNNFYSLILYINRNSRILQKDVKDYITLHKKVEIYNSSKIYKKYIITKAPLCSKAKKLLMDNGWIVGD